MTNPPPKQCCEERHDCGNPNCPCHQPKEEKAEDLFPMHPVLKEKLESITPPTGECEHEWVVYLSYEDYAVCHKCGTHDWKEEPRKNHPTAKVECLLEERVCKSFHKDHLPMIQESPKPSPISDWGNESEITIFKIKSFIEELENKFNGTTSTCSENNFGCHCAIFEMVEDKLLSSQREAEGRVLQRVREKLEHEYSFVHIALGHTQPIPPPFNPEQRMYYKGQERIIRIVLSLLTELKS